MITRMFGTRATFAHALRALFAVFFAAFFALGIAGARAQQAETRFAFVIGNDGYERGALPTAANDAALVADALRLAGFDVTGARNLDQDTFRAAYREFVAKVAAAGTGGVAAVYISGHGLQFEGENYFLPVGATIARESDIGLNAIRLADLTRPLAGLNGRGQIFLFDLAYGAPQVTTAQPLASGLSAITADKGLLIGFNQAPGLAAPVPALPYGPYARAISEMIRVGGLSADAMMDRVRLRVVELTQNRQVPWHQAMIEPPLMLLEAAQGTAAASPAPAARLEQADIRELGAKQGYAAALKRDTIRDYQAYIEAYPDAAEAKRARKLLAARREALFWARTTQRNTANAYWTYLKSYPRGPHAGEARRRLERLSQPLDAPPDAEYVEYDIAPPSADELVYFTNGAVEIDEPVIVTEIIDDVAPPPVWWQPPPPPDYADEDDYFLPTPRRVEGAPIMVAPPAYVAEPLMQRAAPGAGDSLRAIAPYVAIPAAVAAGIAAGKLLNKRRGTPAAMPAPGGPGVGPQGAMPAPGQRLRPMPPVTLPPGQSHAAPGQRDAPAVTPPVPPRVPPVVATPGTPPAAQPPRTLPGQIPPVPPTGARGPVQGLPGQTAPGQVAPGQPATGQALPGQVAPPAQRPAGLPPVAPPATRQQGAQQPPQAAPQGTPPTPPAGSRPPQQGQSLPQLAPGQTQPQQAAPPPAQPRRTAPPPAQTQQTAPPAGATPPVGAASPADARRRAIEERQQEIQRQRALGRERAQERANELARQREQRQREMQRAAPPPQAQPRFAPPPQVQQRMAPPPQMPPRAAPPPQAPPRAAPPPQVQQRMAPPPQLPPRAAPPPQAPPRMAPPPQAPVRTGPPPGRGGPPRCGVPGLPPCP